MPAAAVRVLVGGVAARLAGTALRAGDPRARSRRHRALSATRCAHSCSVLGWQYTCQAGKAAGRARARAIADDGLGGNRRTGEKVRHAIAADFAIEDITSLNTIAVEVVAGADARALSLSPGLDDGLFESDGQLTKRDVRAVTRLRWSRDRASCCGISGLARGLLRSNGSCGIRR